MPAPLTLTERGALLYDEARSLHIALIAGDFQSALDSLNAVIDMTAALRQQLLAILPKWEVA